MIKTKEISILLIFYMCGFSSFAFPNGKIDGLLFDSWDSGWPGISYEKISFEKIYKHIKSLQQECLVREHNSSKYPQEGFFYADIKHYVQNAGQEISKETNQLPAQAGIPINSTWFWKETSPEKTVKNAKFIVENNLVPLNDAHCNLILNMAPDRNGLIDAILISI